MSGIFILLALLLPYSVQSALSIRPEEYRQGLQKAKYFMLKGDLAKSKFFLAQIPPAPIKNRYLSLIHFIEENYRKSLIGLSEPSFLGVTLYPHTCTLRIINQLTLTRNNEVRRELSLCAKAIDPFSKNEVFWFNFLQTLFQGQVPTQAHLATNLPHLAMWLKWVLYSQGEKELIPLIAEFPPSVYSSKKIRELLAVIYYRTGDLNRAASFIKGITSLNALNIAGNIALQKKDYAKALNSFQEALKIRANSLNALSQALPLAYRLGRWEDGLNILSSIANIQGESEFSLEYIMFLIFAGKFKDAGREIALLDKKYRFAMPHSASVMGTYVALQEGDSDSLRTFASRACRQFDGFACWALLQQLSWNEFTPLVSEEGKIFPSPINIDQYRNRSVVTPLKERVLVPTELARELDSSEFN